MLLPSQHRELTETYKQLYLGEVDDITDVMIEEVVEELVEECVEFGYSLEESADIVEKAALEYFVEATVTYGSDTESPEQRRARARAKVGEKRKEARKAAVKGAVERVKSKAKGAKAAAGIAGSIAKDEARRAGRAAAHAVTSTVQKKKAQVKSGVKGLLKKGLSAVAGGAGAVAQKARKVGAAAGKAADRLGEEVREDHWDLVLEYLVAEGHADTNEEAIAIMANMDKKMIQSILETRMDPRGRPASGPMNVYAKNKPNTDPKFQAALKAVRDADAKKTPEQRKAELDAYKARQANK